MASKVGVATPRNQIETRPSTVALAFRHSLLEHVPGSCTTNRQHADVAPADIDWVATISARSFFGVPVRYYRATCGGTAIT